MNISSYHPSVHSTYDLKIMKYHKVTVERAGLIDGKKQKILLIDQKKKETRITTAENEQTIVDLIEQDVDEGIKRKQIQEQGRNISLRTVQHRLVERGSKYSRSLSMSRLSQ